MRTLWRGFHEGDWLTSKVGAGIWHFARHADHDGLSRILFDRQSDRRGGRREILAEAKRSCDRNRIGGEKAVSVRVGVRIQWRSGVAPTVRARQTGSG